MEPAHPMRQHRNGLQAGNKNSGVSGEYRDETTEDTADADRGAPELTRPYMVYPAIATSLCELSISGRALPSALMANGSEPDGSCHGILLRLVGCSLPAKGYLLFLFFVDPHPLLIASSTVDRSAGGCVNFANHLVIFPQRFRISMPWLRTFSLTWSARQPPSGSLTK